jgi:hypothetical protein
MIREWWIDFDEWTCAVCTACYGWLMKSVSKLVFADGVQRIVAALQKAGHDAAADIADSTLTIGGASLKISEDWSSGTWSGVAIKFAGHRFHVTKTGRVPVNEIVAAWSRERSRLASENAKAIAAAEAKRAIEEVRVANTEVKVGSPWLYFDSNVPTMPLELRVSHIRAEQVRPLLEAIRGALAGTEA